MKLFLKHGLLLLTVTASFPLLAQRKEFEYGMWQSQKNSMEARAYMHGVLDGIYGINAINQGRGLKGAFCPTDELVRLGDLEKIVEEVAMTVPKERRNSVAVFALAAFGLAEKYPCK